MKQQHWNGRDFPAIVESSGDLPAYLKSKKADVGLLLKNAGTVLFRGFDVAAPEDFDAVVEAYGDDNFAYKESLSNAVRVNVTPRVFTANEAPPETSIYLHHEMAQTPIYPSKLFFYCQIAADKGGATPLCRSDVLLEKLAKEDPDLVQAFADKGVRYSSTMPLENDAGSGQGRSWRSTLSCESKEGAEARLQALGYEWKWQEHESLRVTTPVLSAVRSVDDGRRVFFNQLIAAFRGWSDSRNDASKSICFGDGTAITPDHMAGAIRLADELSFDLQWQSGDVALIDNFTVMHGRRPFEGTRRVLASLIK